MKLIQKSLIGLILLGLLLAPAICMAAETQEIIDILGNSVEIPADISRVVTIDPFTSQFVYVIGADEQLVGTCIGPSNRNLVNETLKSIAFLPSAGCKDSLNVEELLKLNPEVVIADQRYVKAIGDMKNANIPIVLVDLESPESLIKSYEILGKVFGKEKAAGEFLDYFNSRMSLVSKVGANISESERKTVYFGQRDPLSTLGDDYYEAGIAREVGMNNVASGISGGSNKVSMDQVYKWNPDIIILLPYCSTSVDELLNDEAWKSLPAVQNKQVYRMPKYLMSWELPVPESVLSALWLQNTIYPDKVSYDLKDEIISFYKDYYHLDLTADDVEKMLTDDAPIVLNKPQP